jgi:hypothetical protein
MFLRSLQRTCINWTCLQPPSKTVLLIFDQRYSQTTTKNVNNFFMNFFLLGKNLFNIVSGILFPYLLTHRHISSATAELLFLLPSIQ